MDQKKKVSPFIIIFCLISLINIQAGQAKEIVKRDAAMMMDDEGMMDQGSMRDMMGAMMGNGGMMQNMMRDMQPIHDLLKQHEKIKRRVKDIPGGIES